jgi:hypothetical protein
LSKTNAMPDQQWEYLVLTDNSTHPSESTLNAKGRKGWEVVSCYALEVNTGAGIMDECCVVLKRPWRADAVPDVEDEEDIELE